MSAKLVLFDLGGVLADLGSPAARMRLPMSEAEFWELWLALPAVRTFEVGAIGADEFLAGLSRELGLAESAEVFRRRFLRWRLELYPAADPLLKRVSEQCDVALLSNTNPFHWSMVREQTDAFERFRHVFLSYEIGVLKPDAAIFEHVLETAEMAPADIVFFDDYAQNVAAAARLGIDAVRVQGTGELCRALAARGIDPGPVD